MRLTRMAIAAAPMLFVLLWSTGFIGARYGLPYIEPLTFLAVRMVFVVLVMAAIALIARRALAARTRDRPQPGGRLAGARALSRRRVHRHQPGRAGRHLGADPGPAADPHLDHRQPLHGREGDALQWVGLALGLVGVAMVLHDRRMVAEGSVLGWVASFVSLIGITLGTLYQKRFCGGIDWRTGNIVQYVGAAVLFGLGAFAFETRVIHWTGELIFAMAWLVFVLSIAAVALMYWLIRRSAATGFASLFYLVPAVTALFAYGLFGEKLDALSVAGMVVCAAGVVLANRGAAKPAAKT